MTATSPLFDGTDPLVSQTIQIMRQAFAASSARMAVEVYPDSIEIKFYDQANLDKKLGEAQALLTVGPSYEIISADMRGEDYTLDLQLSRIAYTSPEGLQPGLSALARLWANVRNPENEKALRSVIEVVMAQIAAVRPEQQLSRVMQLVVSPLMQHQIHSMASPMQVGHESASGHLVLQEATAYLMGVLLAETPDLATGRYFLQGVAFVTGYLESLAKSFSEAAIEKPIA